MATAFDDLIPTAPVPIAGAFDDLVPVASTESAFADLVPETTPETIATKLRDPAYTPTRSEFQVWKQSEDAKPWFQPGEWADAFASGVGAIRDTAVNAGKSLFGPQSVLENPMAAIQTGLEAAARGTANDVELFGHKVPTAVNAVISNVGQAAIGALTGQKLDAKENYFLHGKLLAANRQGNPTGSPVFTDLRMEDIPRKLMNEWRAEYRQQFKPEADYQEFIGHRAAIRDHLATSEGRANLVPPILSPQTDQALAEAGSLVANPSSLVTMGLGAAPRTGATLLERGAAAAATGVGRGAVAAGKAAQLVAKFPAALVARGVELAGGTADTAAAAAKLVEGGSIGATLASPAVAVPGLTQAAIAMQAAKRGGQLLEAAGEASGAVGRSLAEEPSRTGLLGTIATDGKAPQWIRTAAASAKAIDPALEFAGRTFESGVHGAGIGAVFGGLAEGTPEGVAQGAGAGFGLGAGFGTVGRVIGWRANLEAKRQADLNRWFAGKAPEEQAQIHALGMDRNQALRLATTEQFVRGMRGANGESDVRFQYVDNATFERAFGTSAKGAEHIAADQPVIVINVDRANGRTPLHEAMHGLLDLGLTPEVKAELQRKLFTQQAPDGTVLTEGVFSHDDQQRSLQQYTDRLSAQARAEFNLLSATEQLAKIRTELAAEAFANLVEGKGPDYLLKGLTGVRRRMADSLIQAQQGTLLNMMRKGLEALGVKFDSSGAPSELFVKNGQPVTNSPEVDAALRDYLRAKTKVLNRLAAAEDSPAGLVVTRQDMMSKNAKAVAELFKDNDNFKKDATGAVVIERGLPVLNTPREIAKVQSKRVEEIISALERSPRAIGGNSRQPMRLKPNGAWEGHYFTPEQMAEIDRIPHDIIAPSLKEKIRKLNIFHAPGDGRRYVIDYNAATKEAKGGGRVYSSSISSTLRDVVPLTFHVSKAGNFYTTVLDTTVMHAKLNRWFREHPRAFDAWGGNRDAFIADVFKYLDNHASDRPGSYGLDSGAAAAVHKKNVINDLFGVARGSGANPLDLSTKSGKDNLIKSFRLDRTNRITESGGEKMPFDYYKAKANLLPLAFDEKGARAIESKIEKLQSDENILLKQVMAEKNRTREGELQDERASIFKQVAQLRKELARLKVPAYDEIRAIVTQGIGETGAMMLPDDISEFVLYRGEREVPNIIGVKEVTSDSSRISNSFYPTVELLMDNGAKKWVLIRVSDHGQVSRNSPYIYSHDIRFSGRINSRGNEYTKTLQKAIAEELQATINQEWKEQRDILQNANATSEGGVAGIKTPSETSSQRAEAQADKGNVSALRTEATSALTGQKTPQPPSNVNLLPAGKEWTATTPSAGVPVKGKYELREAKDLVTSFDAGFDAALQPRDRTREASVNQIAGIVQKFEPQRLGEAPTTDLGAPVIDDAGQVLSGNGRVTSLRTIYNAQDPSRGDGYKQFLMQNAEQFGFKAADIAGMAEPVLVRRVDDYGGLAKAEFARQSNQSQLLAMSGAEKAAADARLLTEHPDILDKFAPSEEGNVMATSNHDFLNHFIAATGDQAELLSGKGYNNELVRKRVETAILATVIGPENRKLITQMIERADKFKVRKAVNGLMLSAPSLVKLKGTAYDLSPYLSQAMGDLVRMRGASENVETFLASKPLVGDDGRTAASDHILEFLSKAKSQKQVAEDLRRYLFMAKNAIADAQSGGLFGDSPRSREQLLGEIYGRIIRPTEPANLPAAATSAFADLIPVEAAQPASSPAPVAAQPVAAPAPVRPAPVAAPVVTPVVKESLTTAPPRPRNAVVADWTFRRGSPQVRAGAGSFLPTGAALRASAAEIVQHTRDEAAYNFSERMEGVPRSASLTLAREFLLKSESLQPPGLLATERTRRAAAALARVPAETLLPLIVSGGLNAVRRQMQFHLTAPPAPAGYRGN